MTDLRKAVTEHIKDLRKTAIVLAEYPQLKNSSLEVAKAADELEAALAQPEQEPFFDITAAVDAAMVEMKNLHPPMRRSECERLIKAALYTAPPSKPWVSLTDDEVWEAYEKGMHEDMWFARAIEAKLKEKNT